MNLYYNSSFSKYLLTSLLMCINVFVRVCCCSNEGYSPSNYVKESTDIGLHQHE